MSTPESSVCLTDEEKIRISSVAGQGLHTHLYQSSVVMFDESPQFHNVSSGTLISINGRVFIATAAHNIPPNPSTRLQILPDVPRLTSKGILRPGLSGKNIDLDVGFIELDANAVAEFFPNKVCCGLDRLSIDGPGDPKQLMVLLGSPKQFVETSCDVNTPPFKARVMAIASIVLSKEEWPSTLNSKPLNPQTDVVVDFQRNGWSCLDTRTEIQLDTPHGFSGGGLWSANMQSGAVWSPYDSRLFAIEIEWDQSLRKMKATQIVHWLNLLRTEVPELRETLEAMFPQLSSMPSMS
jgi:hypothetical protein